MSASEQGKAATAEKGRLQFAPVQEKIAAEEGPIASAAGQKVSPEAERLVARAQEEQRRRERRPQLHQHREREERGERGQRRIGHQQLRHEDQGGKVQRQAGVAEAGQAIQDRVRDKSGNLSGWIWLENNLRFDLDAFMNHDASASFEN